MKSCFSCEAVKPLTQFYTHPRMADGHLNKCKDCVKAYAKQRRLTTDAVREYDSKRSGLPSRVKLRAAITQRWRKQHPDRYAAHSAVSNALRDRKLSKRPCFVCGEPEVHAHHEDYSKPLDVTWLCPLHHARHHAGAGKNSVLDRSLARG